MSPAFKALSTVCRGHSVKIVRSFQKEATKRLGISLDDHFGTNGNLVSVVGRGSQKRCKVCIVHVWEEDIGGKNGRPRSSSPIFFSMCPVLLSSDQPKSLFLHFQRKRWKATIRLNVSLAPSFPRVTTCGKSCFFEHVFFKSDANGSFVDWSYQLVRR